MDACEGFFDIGGIEADERILTDFGAMNGFDSNLVDVAFAFFQVGFGCFARMRWRKAT